MGDQGWDAPHEQLVLVHVEFETDSGAPDPIALDFINREIDRHLQTWKHLDERVLGAAPPFLTLTAALVPAAVPLSGTVNDPRRFYIACSPLLVFVASIGLLVSTYRLSPTT